ncbi:hypothetical protein SK128_005016, partial [Halocaridina rubra]
MQSNNKNMEFASAAGPVQPKMKSISLSRGDIEVSYKMYLKKLSKYHCPTASKGETQRIYIQTNRIVHNASSFKIWNYINNKRGKGKDSGFKYSYMKKSWRFVDEVTEYDDRQNSVTNMSSAKKGICNNEAENIWLLNTRPISTTASTLNPIKALDPIRALDSGIRPSTFETTSLDYSRPRTQDTPSLDHNRPKELSKRYGVTSDQIMDAQTTSLDYSRPRTQDTPSLDHNRPKEPLKSYGVTSDQIMDVQNVGTKYVDYNGQMNKINHSGSQAEVQSSSESEDFDVNDREL